LELESRFDFDLELESSRFDFESEFVVDDDDDDDSCCVCFRQLFKGKRVGSKGLDVRVNVFFSLLDGDRGMLDVFRSDRVKVWDAFLSLLGGDFDFLEDAGFDLAAGDGDGDCDGDEGCSLDFTLELELKLEFVFAFAFAFVFEMRVNVFWGVLEDDDGEDDGDLDGNEGNLDADILNERERVNARGVVVGVSGLSGP